MGDFAHKIKFSKFLNTNNSIYYNSLYQLLSFFNISTDNGLDVLVQANQSFSHTLLIFNCAAKQLLFKLSVCRRLDVCVGC